MSRAMKIARLLPLLLVAPALAHAQAETQAIAPILKDEILAPTVALRELRDHVVARVPKPPAPASAAEWSEWSRRTRQTLLDEVVYHGWPRQWVEARPRFEETGVIEAPGYRIRKLRYEIVPGMTGAALLYEPAAGGSRRAAILNVNGHVGAPGKSVEYKQKRCITFAKNGVMALDLEWLGYGELSGKDNSHWYLPHLDLVGVEGAGLLYLAMRRGLDYLYEHPDVDRERIGMTGLSGGGWQTIVLSALDERIRASAPVAGFNGMAAKAVARAYGDTGDPEQSATDLFAAVDYPHLAALVAPRPLLLAYNAEDNCCFRSGMAKPVIEAPARRVYELLGRGGALAWHENLDPGTHNYQLDNREQAYRFFSRAFALRPAIETDHKEAAAELRAYEDLVVGLPADNLTILGLARRFAAGFEREALPAEAARARLRGVVRYRPAALEATWLVASTKQRGVETASYLFRTREGLSATGVWLRATSAPEAAPATVVLDDRERSLSADAVAERLNRGEQVLALDLALLGEAWSERETRRLQQNLYGLGERPLGLAAAQLVAVSRWLAPGSGGPRLQARGPRSQLVALTAAALEPSLFSEVAVTGGLTSLADVLVTPVEYLDAPELFCPGLHQAFDLDRLAALAPPTRVRRQP